MAYLPDLDSPAGIGAMLVVLVVAAIVLRRLYRAWATRSPPRTVIPMPLETDTAFLDSSHIIEGPLLGGATDRQARLTPAPPAGDGAGNRGAPPRKGSDGTP